MVSERRGPSRKRFQASIRVGGTIRYLGSFPTKEERDERIRQAREERTATGTVETESVFVDSEIDDPWLSPTRQFTPERRLCAAMLLQAARDLASTAPGEAHLRSGARRWVTSRATSFGSFLFCVETLGRDVATTREVMLRIGDAEKSVRVEGGEWQREPTRPLTLVRKGSAEN